MEWVSVIVLVVGFLVWLLSNLTRSNEAARRPGAPAGQENQPRQRPSTTEIDRFLEEINRRRQQQQQRRSAPVEAVEPVAPVPPRREERPRPRPAPRTPQRPTVRSTYTAPPPVQAIPTVLPVAQVVATEPTASYKPIRTLPPAPLPPQLKAARQLLTSGQGLQTAVLLMEIFGPPRCKRPR
jgi:hypothetical protein